MSKILPLLYSQALPKTGDQSQQRLIWPGNYDEYMTAATAARERLQADNARKKAQIAELQAFVSRFSANASKARQATSRVKQIDKIQLTEIKPSSRQNPFIRFEQEKKLFRNALVVEKLSQGYEDDLFSNVNLMVEVGERIAIIGQNGIGKTTLLHTLAGKMVPRSGTIQWSENANIGYYAQNHSSDFDMDMNLFDWMSQWMNEGDDEQVIRGVLGRMLLGKLIQQRPNILLMDEPTNHMDMESIESLNLALENYKGTLIFVSHDRQFVSSLATRIIEIKDNGIVDFLTTTTCAVRASSNRQVTLCPSQF